MRKEELEVLILALTHYIDCTTFKDRKKVARKLLKIFVKENNNFHLKVGKEKI